MQAMQDALSSALGFILSHRPKKHSWRGANDDGLLRSCVAQNIYSASNQLFSNPWIPPCDVFSSRQYKSANLVSIVKILNLCIYLYILIRFLWDCELCLKSITGITWTESFRLRSQPEFQMRGKQTLSSKLYSLYHCFHILSQAVNIFAHRQVASPVSLSSLNPLTPMSDQDRISPHNISTISNRQVMRIKKNMNKGLLVDSIPSSSN